MKKLITTLALLVVTSFNVQANSKLPCQVVDTWNWMTARVDIRLVQVIDAGKFQYLNFNNDMMVVIQDPNASRKLHAGLTMSQIFQQSYLKRIAKVQAPNQQGFMMDKYVFMITSRSVFNQCSNKLVGRKDH